MSQEIQNLINQLNLETYEVKLWADYRIEKPSPELKCIIVQSDPVSAWVLYRSQGREEWVTREGYGVHFRYWMPLPKNLALEREKAFMADFVNARGGAYRGHPDGRPVL